MKNFFIINFRGNQISSDIRFMNLGQFFHVFRPTGLLPYICMYFEDFRRKWKETVRSVVNDSKIVNDDKCLDMNSEAKLDYQLLYGRCAREWATLPDDAALPCLPLHVPGGAVDRLGEHRGGKTH